MAAHGAMTLDPAKLYFPQGLIVMGARRSDWGRRGRRRAGEPLFGKVLAED